MGFNFGPKNLPKSENSLTKFQLSATTFDFENFFREIFNSSNFFFYVNVAMFCDFSWRIIFLKPTGISNLALRNLLMAALILFLVWHLSCIFIVYSREEAPAVFILCWTIRPHPLTRFPVPRFQLLLEILSTLICCLLMFHQTSLSILSKDAAT